MEARLLTLDRETLTQFQRECNYQAPVVANRVGILIAEIWRLRRVVEGQNDEIARLNKVSNVYGKMRAALTDLLDYDDDCALDHHGYCQAHRLDNPCSVVEYRRLLTEAEELERSDA